MLLFVVSQTEAGVLIQDAGLQVVGWYHSHPTFVPDPSQQGKIHIVDTHVLRMFKTKNIFQSVYSVIVAGIACL